MNRKKTLVPAIVLIIALLGSCSNTRQRYNDENDFTIKVLDDEKSVEITDYVGAKKDVRIPQQIKKLPVTKIGDNAFREKGLTSVTIPNSVTHIGKQAFGSNQLTHVSISGSVTRIGSSAFSYNNLTEIIIPDSITFIEDQVFRGNMLTSITIPEGVVSIGYGAFQYNRLTEITIPNSVISIDRSAFNGDFHRPHENNITKITIGENVEIEFDTFRDFGFFYNSSVMKKGGTYIYSNYHWSPEDKTIPVYKFKSNGGENFTDLNFLTDMPDLEYVELIGNNLLTDITPLSKLTKLSELYIYRCKNIKSLEPLASLFNLQRISITHNNYDYRVLVPLQQLEMLHILIYNYTDEIDLSHVGQLHFLKRLIISNESYSGTKIMRISGLQNPVNLETLEIIGVDNSGISWVSNLRNLTDLSFTSWTINDISPLANLPNLVKVRLVDNRIKDIAPLLNSNSIKYITVWAHDVEAGISDELRSRFAQKNIHLDTFYDSR